MWGPRKQSNAIQDDAALKRMTILTPEQARARVLDEQEQLCELINDATTALSSVLNVSTECDNLLRLFNKEINLCSSDQGRKGLDGEKEAIKAYGAVQEENSKDAESDVGDNVSSALLNRANGMLRKFEKETIGVVSKERENFVRLEDLDSGTAVNSDKGGMKRHGFTSEGLGNTGFSKNSASKSIRLGMKKKSQGLMTFSKSLRSGVTRAVFPEELKVSREKIFDPQDRFLLFWNKLFVISSIVSVYLDPLFFYLPVFENAEMCLHIDRSLAHFIVTMRCIVDSFYIFRIVLQFRTAYIAPSSRVFGRGELVIDPGEIANRYLHRYFVIDVLSILPLPQIAVWRVLQKSGDADVLATKKALLILILIQWIPRFWRFLPLISDMKKTVGVVTESAWAGAAYYLLWFVLASHVVGSLWYILAVERKDACWEKACSTSNKCKKYYLQGRQNVYGGGRERWAALKIQSVFRGYLSRKALRALKGLVKLQALVRGYLVRKRATATLRSMQALIRAQVAIRAQRALIKCFFVDIYQNIQDYDISNIEESSASGKLIDWHDEEGFPAENPSPEIVDQECQ
ncbi:hypothetical protein POM88_021546 [Heracleum sosnowskyi]|uniref:Ion transport domain-containing protein n=1 Tax=Heracleum sosnowskyi TaxID=360622 RepID=A0AAD8IE32_9APIA|nr:hypothetical protein POM88_021546 [Heracleum sosnowskyi]